jgi:exportin-T
VTGTDDSVVRADTKRAYLTLLNSIMSSKLQDVFISDRTSSPLIKNLGTLTRLPYAGNKAVFEPLLESMEHLAEDTSDAQSEKAAFIFLRHCVNVWGQPLEGTPSTSKGPAEAPSQGLPGFERFIYERLVPTAFRVPSSPQFNLKDGQVLVVSPPTPLTAWYLQRFNATRSGPTRDC